MSSAIFSQSFKKRRHNLPYKTEKKQGINCPLKNKKQGMICPIKQKKQGMICPITQKKAGYDLPYGTKSRV